MSTCICENCCHQHKKLRKEGRTNCTCAGRGCINMIIPPINHYEVKQCSCSICQNDHYELRRNGIEKCECLRCDIFELQFMLKNKDEVVNPKYELLFSTLEKLCALIRQTNGFNEKSTKIQKDISNAFYDNIF